MELYYVVGLVLLFCIAYLFGTWKRGKSTTYEFVVGTYIAVLIADFILLLAFEEHRGWTRWAITIPAMVLACVALAAKLAGLRKPVKEEGGRKEPSSVE